MNAWGLGTALIGVLCYIAGWLHGSTAPRHTRSSWEAPRVMEPVEQPPPEKTLAERQFDEIVGGDPWRDTP